MPLGLDSILPETLKCLNDLLLRLGLVHEIVEIRIAL